MSKKTTSDSNYAAHTEPAAGEPFQVLTEAPLPPVNEFLRFVKVFCRRKVVVFGLFLVIIILIAALFPNQVATNDPFAMDLRRGLEGPSSDFWLGTDALGRCTYSRIVHGARLAMQVGVATVLVSSVIGTVLGLLAGFGGRLLEEIIMRFTDAWISIPGMILIMLLATIMGRGVFGLVLAVALGGFPGYIRLVYGQVMTVKQNDYILASVSMGDSKLRIMFKHILPNCISPMIVAMTMGLGGGVMAEAGLSFIGLGLAPPTPAWGTMTDTGRTHLATLPILSLAPGLAIVILVFGFNMVGDGIRDALDPKMRGTND